MELQAQLSLQSGVRFEFLYKSFAKKKKRRICPSWREGKKLFSGRGFLCLSAINGTFGIPAHPSVHEE